MSTFKKENSVTSDDYTHVMMFTVSSYVMGENVKWRITSDMAIGFSKKIEPTEQRMLMMSCMAVENLEWIYPLYRINRLSTAWLLYIINNIHSAASSAVYWNLYTLSTYPLVVYYFFIILWNLEFIHLTGQPETDGWFDESQFSFVEVIHFYKSLFDYD